MPINSSSEAPLLNEDKRDFVKRRLLQTLFSGLILKFESELKVPIYIYLFQLLIFLIPFLIGSIGILIRDLINLNSLYVTSVASSIYFITILTIKLIAILLNIKQQQQNKTKENFKQNRFKQEDFIDFDSPCSFQTFNFLVPIDLSKVSTKSIIFIILRLIIDLLVAFFVFYSTVQFNYISYLYEFYSYGHFIVFIFSWLTVCLSLNSLLIKNPPETAIHDISERLFDLKHYTRSFYVSLFYIIEWLFNYTLVIPKEVIFWLKLIFIFLPILWFFGILPPLETFLVYTGEQINIYFYGGTAISSYVRLIVQLTLATLLSLVYFIPNDIAQIALLAGFGYLFSSIEFVELFNTLRRLSLNRTHPTDKEPENLNKNKINTCCRYFKQVIYHLVVFLATIGVSMLVYNLFTFYNITKTDAFQVEQIILYISLGILILSKLFGDLQSIYLLFGYIKNPFYKINDSPITHDKAKYRTVNESQLIFVLLKILKILLLKFLAPLFLLVSITIDCYINKVYNDTTYGYMRTIFVLRAYRWIWQSTFNCLIEMTLMVNLILLVIVYNSTNDSSLKANLVQNFLPACFAASFILNRLIEFVHKLYAFILIMHKSWSMKSQRSRISIIFVILNSILFVPYILPLFILSSLFNTPILPLFTAPIFLMAYPRYKRFWPIQSNQQQQQQQTIDSQFYEQIKDGFKESFKEAIKSGSIGSSIESDTYFLCRFQDRTLWIQTLESGHSYCVFNIKGLELQETSCHTQEAQFIDDKINQIINQTGDRILFDCMQICDFLVFNAYSDAKNSLVGIIDNQETHKIIHDYFTKILYYFIIEYLLNEKNLIRNKSEIFDVKKDEDTSISQEKFKLPSINIKNAIFEENDETDDDNENDDWIDESPTKTLSPSNIKHSDDWNDDDDDLFDILKPLDKQKLNPIKQKQEINSFNFDSDFEMTPKKVKKKQKKIKSNVFEFSLIKDDPNAYLFIPLEWSKLLQNNMKFNKTDKSELKVWLHKILRNLANIKDELLTNDQFNNNYIKSHLNFLMLCVDLVDLSLLNSSQIYQLFTGDKIKQSLNVNDRQNSLLKILTNSIRYSIKLAIDSIVYGSSYDDDELYDEIKKHNKEWFIGIESDEEFLKNLKETKSIFSLSYDQRNVSLSVY